MNIRLKVLAFFLCLMRLNSLHAAAAAAVAAPPESEYELVPIDYKVIEENAQSVHHALSNIIGIDIDSGEKITQPLPPPVVKTILEYTQRDRNKPGILGFAPSTQKFCVDPRNPDFVYAINSDYSRCHLMRYDTFDKYNLATGKKEAQYELATNKSTSQIADFAVFDNHLIGISHTGCLFYKNLNCNSRGWHRNQTLMASMALDTENLNKICRIKLSPDSRNLLVQRGTMVYVLDTKQLNKEPHWAQIPKPDPAWSVNKIVWYDKNNFGPALQKIDDDAPTNETQELINGMFANRPGFPMYGARYYHRGAKITPIPGGFIKKESGKSALLYLTHVDPIGLAYRRGKQLDLTPKTPSIRQAKVATKPRSRTTKFEEICYRQTPTTNQTIVLCKEPIPINTDNDMILRQIPLSPTAAAASALPIPTPPSPRAAAILPVPPVIPPAAPPLPIPPAPLPTAALPVAPLAAALPLAIAPIPAAPPAAAARNSLANDSRKSKSKLLRNIGIATGVTAVVGFSAWLLTKKLHQKK